MEELIAPPRTLDVQQFAKSRATELLSLRSALKTRKRKAPSQEDGTCHDEVDGNAVVGDGKGSGDDQTDDLGLSNTLTSLPRHLRRRTSSYAHRRCPLPWLYKRKKNEPASSVLRPKKRRKKMKKQRQLPQQNISLDDVFFPTQDASRDNMIAHQVPGFTPGVGSDGIGSEDGLNKRFLALQSAFVAPMSALTTQATLLQHQQEPLAVQPQGCINCDMISITIPGANASVQMEATGDAALLENMEVAVASTHVACIMSEDKSADLPSQMVAQEAFLEEFDYAILVRNEVHEDGGIISFQRDGDIIVSLSRDSIAAPPAQIVSQAAQQEVVQSERVYLASQGDKDTFVSLSRDNITAPPAQIACQADQQEVLQSERVYLAPMNVDCIAATVQAESHEMQQEFLVNRENSVCTRVDDATASSYHTIQQDSIDLNFSEDGHAPMCIDSLGLGTQVGTLEVQDIKKKKKKNISRPLRRLLEFKPGGCPILSDGTRRLRTHVWHAKRFSIERMWGYRIPVGRHGRGHGSRSTLRWSKSKAILHDCSFINAIQLHGTEEMIMQVLRPVLELPQGIESSFEAGERTSLGRHFTSAILHPVGQAFHGIISPVTLMWKPIMAEVSTSSCTAKERSVWLWVHAAAFEEAYQAIHDMCLKVNKQIKEERVVCFLRRGDLGRLDLIGEGAFAVLEKVLVPIYRDHQGKCIKHGKLAEVLNSNQVNGKAVVHLEVSDPRLKENERCLALDPTCVSPVAVYDDRDSKSKDFVEDCKSTKVEVEHEQETLNPIQGEEAHDCYSSIKSIGALWACEATPFQQKLEQPITEKFLSRMRHTDRLDAFGLTQTAKTNRMLKRRKNLSGRFICPVILLKHEHREASTCGWSLILPLSWVSAFWVPLVFAGGHAIGIRERHWLCTDAGSPSFPVDFPDCKAYKDIKVDKSSEGAHLLPKRVRVIWPPEPEEVCACGQEGVIQGRLVRSVSMSCPPDEGESQNVTVPAHGFFVARTSEQLSAYLQTTKQKGLLLFPAQNQAPTKLKGLGSRLHEGSVVWRLKPQNLQAPRIYHSLQAFCLLRVCLRPFCKGVAKVGAKVYAPTSDDYMVWSWKEIASGTSVSGVRGSKEVIGYVTSMAPRGSKLSAAIAFCNAIALGLARERQWVDTTWHKKSEVFLMFCNEGSTTCRPAFGSICIEAGPDI